MSITNQSSVVLDNVDDYLAPSQACINPLFQPTQEAATATTTEEKKDEGLVRPRRRKVVRKPILVQATSSEDQIERIPTNDNKGDNKKTEAIKASIADCLACSGCVTTAETVLLEQHHSLTSLQQRLSTDDRQGRHYRVLTISPNSLADLCRHWKLSPSRHLPRLVTLLHHILKVNVVVDGNVPLEWTWQEEAEEFVQHYRQRNQQAATSSSTASPPPPSTAIDSTRTMYYLQDGTTPIVTYDPIPSSSSSASLDPYAVPTQIPLLSGSCPALVCLVEKSMPTLVPHLSRTLSPMTRMGLAMLELGGCDHWAIMPCHDKKLEASRKDFLMIPSINGQQQPKPQQAVDLVLTTMELVELMEEYWRGSSSSTITTTTTTKTEVVVNSSEASSLMEYLECLPPAMTWSPNNKDWSMQELQQHLQQQSVVFWTNCNSWTESSPPLTTQSSESDRIAFHSGGHADYIFRYAAQELFGHTISHVQWTPTLQSINSLTNGSSTMKSLRLANLQKKQQSYQAVLYRQNNSMGGSYTQEEGQEHQQQQDDKGQEPVLRFAMVRGMQTMQRTLKDLDSSSNWDYVEAMACPHGCVNGGGSVRTHKESTIMIKETPTETKLRVDQTIQALNIPKPSSMVAQVLHPPRPRFQTRYHVVPPMHHTLGAADGVKVQDMQW